MPKHVGDLLRSDEHNFACKLGYTINEPAAYISLLILKTKWCTCRSNAGNVSRLERRRRNCTLHGEIRQNRLTAVGILNLKLLTVVRGLRLSLQHWVISPSACHLYFSCRSSRRNLQSCGNKRLWEADVDDEVIICLYHKNKHTACFIAEGSCCIQ
jgi:hypothetical protein